MSAVLLHTNAAASAFCTPKSAPSVTWPGCNSISLSARASKLDRSFESLPGFILLGLMIFCGHETGCVVTASNQIKDAHDLFPINETRLPKNRKDINKSLTEAEASNFQSFRTTSSDGTWGDCPEMLLTINTIIISMYYSRVLLPYSVRSNH